MGIKFVRHNEVILPVDTVRELKRNLYKNRKQNTPLIIHLDDALIHKNNWNTAEFLHHKMIWDPDKYDEPNTEEYQKKLIDDNYKLLEKNAKLDNELSYLREAIQTMRTNYNLKLGINDPSIRMESQIKLDCISDILGQLELIRLIEQGGIND